MRPQKKRKEKKKGEKEEGLHSRAHRAEEKVLGRKVAVRGKGVEGWGKWTKNLGHLKMRD